MDAYHASSKANVSPNLETATTPSAPAETPQDSSVIVVEDEEEGDQPIIYPTAKRLKHSPTHASEHPSSPDTSDVVARTKPPPLQQEATSPSIGHPVVILENETGEMLGPARPHQAQSAPSKGMEEGGGTPISGVERIEPSDLVVPLHSPSSLMHHAGGVRTAAATSSSSSLPPPSSLVKEATPQAAQRVASSTSLQESQPHAQQRSAIVASTIPSPNPQSTAEHVVSEQAPAAVSTPPTSSSLMPSSLLHPLRISDSTHPSAVSGGKAVRIGPYDGLNLTLVSALSLSLSLSFFLSFSLSLFLFFFIHPFTRLLLIPF